MLYATLFLPFCSVSFQVTPNFPPHRHACYNSPNNVHAIIPHRLSEFRRVPKHPLDPFGVRFKPQHPVKTHDLGIGIQRNVQYLPSQQRPHHVLHQRLAQPLTLVRWVHDDVPDGGVERIVRGSPAGADQDLFGGITRAVRRDDSRVETGDQIALFEGDSQFSERSLGPPSLAETRDSVSAGRSCSTLANAPVLDSLGTNAKPSPSHTPHRCTSDGKGRRNTEINGLELLLTACEDICVHKRTH